LIVQSRAMLLLVPAMLQAILLSPALRGASRTAIACSAPEPDLTMDDMRSMFAEVRAHYRTSDEGLEEGQVCRNMMTTRTGSLRLDCCRVAASPLHGDGLFASRGIAAGELITFFPGDALLFWESGDRRGDLMITFGAHIPDSERDASHIASERIKQYELYANPRISAVGDPSRRDDPAYLGHFCNDGSTCISPDCLEAYRRDSAASANSEFVVLEGCHFALRAARAIESGEEILATYGEAYWLTRGGHEADAPVSLQVVGADAPKSSSGTKLAQVLAATGKKKLTKGGGGGSKAKGKARKKAGAAKQPTARGFGK